jgi:hypothetical protein
MFSVESTLKDIVKNLDNLKKQERFATAIALTRIARETKNVVDAEILKKVDRPTRYTKNALFIKPATKANLTSEVSLKNKKSGSAKLTVEQTIGNLFTSNNKRNHNGLERWLYRAGLITSREFVAPTSNAKKDTYGNMPRGYIGQIVSQLNSNGGDQSAKGKRARAKVGSIFWSDGLGRMPKGVWARIGRDIKPIALVIREPHYRRLFNIPEAANDTMRKHWGEYYEIALTNAMRTSR